MKEYREFIKKYPNSIATKCLEYFLENYENEDHINIDNGVDEIIKKEFKERYSLNIVRPLKK